MRKTLASAAVLALGIAGVFTAPAATADDSSNPAPPAFSAELPTDIVASTPAPEQALAVAERVLEGLSTAADPSATLALRDLWLSRNELSGADRRAADALLARPTDGAADPFGYPDPSLADKVCNSRICVWYVPSGADIASVSMAQRTLQVVDAAWSSINGMGYRSPVSDAGGDGTAQFDVYLKDVGASSLYGYCAGERQAARRTASGYCVLDNDFSTTQFPSGTPDGNLRVTAAHEFFHAVQFAYDYAEDPWMMEATSTWIEERLADDVDDNRNYLPWSQLYAPQYSLDTFQQGAGMQYGNWIFWEYLSKRYGNGIVRAAWNQSGSLASDGGLYSFQALNKILRKKGTLPNIYARFASDNLVPAKAYTEGRAYPAPRPRATRTLTKGKRAKSFATRVNHMASASYRVKPDSALKGKRWKLRVQVNGPVRATSPRARVIVHLKNGRTQHKNVRLNRKGDGSLRVTFNARRVSAVSVTLVNASTRMVCNRDTYFACAGKARDNGLRYKVNFRAVRS